MTNESILIVEGKKADQPSFAALLQKKDFVVSLVSNGSEAVARLNEISPDMVIVNAATMGSTGVRICQSLREKQEERFPIILILEENKSVERSDADIVLNLPFTVQKLVNRMKPLFPSNGGNILHVGPIRFDMVNNRLRCLGKNERLTPRLANLLQVLIKHRGEVIERGNLYKLVWETDYAGDLRTLDVHISWLRRALEIDPTHPRFLHTVRGIGYRLDV